MTWPALLAATGGLDLPPSSKVPGLVGKDLALIMGLIVLICGAIIAWVIFVRGPKKHPSERRQPLAPPPPRTTITEDGRERVRKKKRARRRDHRQRAPTLSQTGGLPPPRDPEQAESV